MDNEREAFEKWAKEECYAWLLHFDWMDYHYEDSTTQAAWRGWQAAIASMGEVVPRSELESMQNWLSQTQEELNAVKKDTEELIHAADRIANHWNDHNFRLGDAMELLRPLVAKVTTKHGDDDVR